MSVTPKRLSVLSPKVAEQSWHSGRVPRLHEAGQDLTLIHCDLREPLANSHSDVSVTDAVVESRSLLHCSHRRCCNSERKSSF